ncbi:MAG: hypothetical protein V4726_20470, partial [Verrucomicrobiota bacterium]
LVKNGFLSAAPSMPNTLGFQPDCTALNSEFSTGSEAQDSRVVEIIWTAKLGSPAAGSAGPYSLLISGERDAGNRKR